MKIIKQFLIIIFINSILLYVISNYFPELGIQIISEYKDSWIIFTILGIVFWFINSIIKNILKIATLPIKYMTLGISSIIINIMMFYVFEQFVNYLDIGIQVQLGTIIQTTILSFAITIIYIIIKKII